jgi:hypothetical protein
MTGTPPETLLRRTASAKSSGTRLMLLPRIQRPGPAMESVLDGTSSHDFLLVWCTCSAAAESKSSPWLTVGDGRATGGPDSDTPSNFLNAAGGAPRRGDPQP